jgi:hypothetical protein
VFLTKSTHKSTKPKNEEELLDLSDKFHGIFIPPHQVNALEEGTVSTAVFIFRFYVCDCASVQDKWRRNRIRETRGKTDAKNASGTGSY